MSLLLPRAAPSDFATLHFLTACGDSAPWQVLQQHDAPGVLSDPAIVEGFLAAAKASQPLMEQLERVHQTRPEYAGLAAEAEGVAGGKVPILVSGAGHDALAMADITEV